MVIERKGIRLVQLTKEYIELVRQKRNLPEIQKTMEYREYITPEMQQRWFDSTNNINNLYFLIEIKKTFIGLISATGFDWDNNIVNNCGIFIWDKQYLQSPETAWASVLYTDFGFYIGLKKIYIHILADNTKAIAFNKSLGYKLLPGQDGIYNQKYELTAANYFKATQKIRRYSTLNGPLKVTVTKLDHLEILNLPSFKGNENILFQLIV